MEEKKVVVVSLYEQYVLLKRLPSNEDTRAPEKKEKSLERFNVIRSGRY